MRKSLLLAPALAALAACNPVKPVEINLRTHVCGGQDPIQDAKALRFTVFGEGLTAADYRKTTSLTGAPAELPSVTPGTDRSVLVEAMTSGDATGIVRARGSTLPLDLATSKDELSVAVFLRRIDAFTPTQDTADACSAMITPRAAHTATTMADGRVLIAGGYSVDAAGTSYLKSTEIYDPATGTFAAGPEMRLSRAYHTATHVPGTNYTLIVGGENDGVNKPGGALKVAELLDESTGTFTIVQMRNARTRHTAAISPDGTGVFVLGGKSAADSPLASTEIFNPQLKTFEEGPALAGPRSEGTAVGLPGGRVLLVGGFDGTTVVSRTELFSQRPGFTTFGAVASWNVSLTSSNSLPLGAIRPAAALFGTNQVIVTGGYTKRDAGGGFPQQSAVDTTFVIDVPSDDTQQGKATKLTLGLKRANAGAVTLLDGRVLVAGGGYSDANTVKTRNTADLFIANDAQITGAATEFPMMEARYLAAYAVLLDGTVLATGGVSVDSTTQKFLSSAEVYQPPYAAGETPFR